MKPSLLLLAVALAASCQLTSAFTFHTHNQLRKHHRSKTYIPASTDAEDATSSVSLSNEQRLPRRSTRQIRRIERNARLPVWPVWNGIFIWLVQQILGEPTAARLENAITGRVCPNFFQYAETSPFVMLVHHCHSFSTWDPWRYLQRTFFPEGFPAHPHRGFVTVTYILDGGFVHRDSQGVRQEYGSNNPHNHHTSSGDKSPLVSSQEKHTQWLHTGSGMLHEEMFDTRKGSRQELYQLWLNVPRSEKMTEPSTVLLGGPEEPPLVVPQDGSQTLVLAGGWNGYEAAAPIASDVAILHVELAPGQTWTFPNLPESFETIVLYVRKGSGLKCVGNDENDLEEIPVHHVAYMEATGNELVLTNTDQNEVADFLLLAGEPIREPFYANGSMVMSNPDEINQAYSDYQQGLFGQPWDHKLSDEEWHKHVKETSPKRRGQDSFLL